MKITLTIRLLLLALSITTFLHSSEAFHILETLSFCYHQQPVTASTTTSSTMLSMTSSSSSTGAAGPKAAGHRRRPNSRRRRSAGDATSPPSRPEQRRQRQQKQQPAAVFDGKAMTANQLPNEEASPLDLESAIMKESPFSIRCMTSAEKLNFEKEVEGQPFTFMSLDDLLFDNNDEDGDAIKFSYKFNSDSQFRSDLRMAIRKDIFDTTPFYANLPEKAMTCLLLPDSSLEGSWRKKPPPQQQQEEEESMNQQQQRMNQTTIVLKNALGSNAPTGDELFEAIGNLCGSKPTTHWIDIFGVQDRKISHSWHLDSGISPGKDSRTVVWGFPPEDNYEGCGVFSHLVKLQRECVAPDDHPRLEPILFDGTVDEEYIVRPKYMPGKELIMYRDIDVIHSAPDVTYRTSIMRFM